MDSHLFWIVDPDPALQNLQQITLYRVDKEIKDCSKVKNHIASPNLLHSFQKTITTGTNFLAFFLFFPQSFPSWIRLLNADPDPGGKMNADQDPQPWLVVSTALFPCISNVVRIFLQTRFAIL